MKSQTQLNNFIFTFRFHALEKEIATHCSVLAWKISGMEEPGGLQSSQKLLQLYDWPLMLAVRWDLSQHVASPITGHLLLDSAILENRNQSLVTQTLALKAIQG